MSNELIPAKLERRWGNLNAGEVTAFTPGKFAELEKAGVCKALKGPVPKDKTAAEKKAAAAVDKAQPKPGSGPKNKLGRE